jgi:hypothetical protein
MVAPSETTHIANVEIRRNLGDDCTIDLRQEAGEERGLAAAAAEQLHHADPLMALDRGAERVDRLDRAADRGREADAIIGAVDVIIHRLGNGDDGDALLGEVGGKAKRAVAAERHHRVDAEPVERREDAGSLVPGLQRPRVGAGGVEHRAAHPVEAAHALARQRQAVGGDGRRVVWIDGEHALPAAAEPGHLPTEIVGGKGDRPDAGVEAGHVAAAGEDADPHAALPA